MRTVKKGDVVYIMYEAQSENGEVFYKNEDPLELVVGEGKFFPAIEKELQDMKVGDVKTVTLEPKDAFGPHLDELVIEVPKNVIKTNADLKVGSRIKINAPSGKVFYGRITEIKEETLTIDLNHPLAGKRLIFTVTLVSIK